jgi:hypothetical protein
MKRLVPKLLVLLLTMPAAAALSQTPAPSPKSNRERYQPILGNWRGDLLISDGTVVTVVFRIGLGENDSLTVSLDSPTQGREGLPVERASFDGERVTLEMLRVGARYDAVLTAQGAISGQWTQGPITLPLTLERQGWHEPSEPWPGAAAAGLLGAVRRFPQVRSAMVTNAAGRVAWLALFGPLSYFDARGTRFLIGTARTSEVIVLDLSDGSTMHIALPDPVRPFDERDREQFSSSMLARATSAEDSTRRLAQVDLSVFPDVFATHGLVRLDGEGNAWVQRAQESYSDAPSQLWWIFGPDGKQRGTLELPRDDQVVDAGPDYVLLVRKHALGVEQVREHRIVKGN